MNKTITIGISALNEGANIKSLLLSLLEQEGDFNLEKIIVISDGSTDNTASEAKSVSDPRIVVVDDGVRKGKPERQNEICAMSESDILVIFDADILPVNNTHLSNIINPIIQDSNVGLTSGDTIAMPPKNLIEKVLVFALTFRMELFESIRPNNVYQCVGPHRAFSKAFYKTIKWPPAYHEDTYSYLRAIELGFKFKYVKTAKIILRVPGNLSDHLKQSRRFVNGAGQLEKYFDREFIAEQHRIPKTILLSKMLKYLIKNPILFITYFFIVSYSRLFRANSTMKDKWDMATSTKKLT